MGSYEDECYVSPRLVLQLPTKKTLQPMYFFVVLCPENIRPAAACTTRPEIM